MDITSISINTNDGKSYYVPIHSKDSQLESVVKDALLKHLLYKADSDRATSAPISEPMNLKVSINRENVNPRPWVSEKQNPFESFPKASFMQLDCVKKHHLTNVPLARGSSRYKLHEAIVDYFYGANNKWISKQALSANLTHVKKVGLARNTIQTYLSEMVGYGLLQDVTEVDNTKSLRLNPKLIAQAKFDGAVK